MLVEANDRSTGGIFITFSGNCKKALTFYQTCFGGMLHFETFDHELHGYRETLVIHGSLVSPCIVIHGSDLVHNEGRKIGNYLSIFLPCKNIYDRRALLEKLGSDRCSAVTRNYEDSLIEVTDAFDVRWVLGL
ncbi:MAG: glyoxalase [Mucilaginibacter sp.]|uniref:glyoxalase n=1 Tax=Mucilaginibacter sp. TaxID=1882438 RepID=UPI0032657DC4